jgi:hypothetical protein
LHLALRMKTALVVAFLLVFALAASAQQWTWTEHAYPDEGFRVEFNGLVTVRPMQVNAEARKFMEGGTQYMQDGDTNLYVVGASLNKFGTNLDEGAERSFARLECRRRVGDEPVDASWGRGRELRGADCIDGSYEVEARYHQSGPWFYQVIALYKDAGGDATSARYFLRSFRVTR